MIRYLRSASIVFSQRSYWRAITLDGCLLQGADPIQKYSNFYALYENKPFNVTSCITCPERSRLLLFNFKRELRKTVFSMRNNIVDLDRREIEVDLSAYETEEYGTWW